MDGKSHAENETVKQRKGRGREGGREGEREEETNGQEKGGNNRIADKQGCK